MFKGTFKDIITNIMSFLTVVAGVISVIINYTSASDPSNWFTYLMGLALAIGVWFTGKDGTGKAKKSV
jgi:uncharacterized membrane protein HdeD (DUF308 family)